jgi:hypothetical protein
MKLPAHARITLSANGLRVLWTVPVKGFSGAYSFQDCEHSFIFRLAGFENRTVNLTEEAASELFNYVRNRNAG